MTSLTFTEQIKFPCELLCIILSRSLQYLKSGYHRHWLTLTITSLSRDTDATKAATPSCEHMAEMNRSVSHVAGKYPSSCYKERDNIGWVTHAVQAHSTRGHIQSVQQPTESQMTIKHMLERIRSNTWLVFCVAHCQRRENPAVSCPNQPG